MIDLFHAPPIRHWNAPTEVNIPFYRQVVQYDETCDAVVNEVMVARMGLIEEGYEPETLVIDVERFMKLVAFRNHSIRLSHYSSTELLHDLLQSFHGLKVQLVTGSFLQVLPSNKAALSLDFIQKQKESKKD